MAKILNCEIILGTYEEFVIGYRYNSSNEVESNITQTFASHSHSSSIRCITHSGHYLASGGADDRIIVYDLKSRKEHCMLAHHNGTVNCLEFTKDHSHLLSGGSDGILALTRVGNWQLEKVWEKAHKGQPIIDIAIHPSNKLALTLGADNTLRTWNLIKGRQAYIINLNSKTKDPKGLQYIKWAPDAVRFVLCGGLNTDIWSIETGGILKSIAHENKVSYCIFYNDNILAVGFENGHLHMLDLSNNDSKEIEAHNARVKSIDICKGYLITCSSNGEVKIWNENLEKVTECNTGCRHTCICVVVPTWIKKEENENDEEIESQECNDLREANVNETKITKHKKQKKLNVSERVKIVQEAIPKKKRSKFLHSSNMANDTPERVATEKKISENRNKRHSNKQQKINSVENLKTNKLKKKKLKHKAVIKCE